MGRFRRLVRSGTTFLGALALAVVALALPASPAHALPSGAAWSGSWDYYTPDLYQFTGTLPGLEFYGWGSDVNGTRSAQGSVRDTADDGRCARLVLFATGSGYVADVTACGQGRNEGFNTGPFTGNLIIMVRRILPATGAQDKYFHLVIPDSASDPGMRATATGTKWSYYTDTAFQYRVIRPGVKIEGFGWHQTGDLRSVTGAVYNTGSSQSCATGGASGSSGTPASATTCGTGTSASFTTWYLGGWVTAEACYGSSGAARQCLSAYVPTPM
ncbi:MAG TPA: hypothetical protein VK453_13580 [Micromonosporaceae bacterium]|nr:hypothetical protein [Micromonosporaceae bacterium]